MDEAKVRKAAEVAYDVAKDTTEDAYARIWGLVFDAMLRDDSHYNYLNNLTATGVSALLAKQPQSGE